MFKNVELRDDFIGVFDTSIHCNQFIDHLKATEENNTIIRRRSIDHVKVNDDMVTIDSTMVNYNRPVPLLQDYNNLTKQCMDLYIEKFNVVSGYDLQQAYMNIQRTQPSQGYHAWLCEDDHYGAHRKLFATMLYLNDVEEGGETEFLYQKVRFKPQKGRFLMWPAHWTHIHRGNPPLSGEKYIATSWIENQEI